MKKSEESEFYLASIWGPSVTMAKHLPWLQWEWDCILIHSMWRKTNQLRIMPLFIRFKLLPQLFLTALSKSCFKSQRLPSGVLFPMYCVTMQNSWPSDVTTGHSKQGLLWGTATFPHRNDIYLWMSLVTTSKSGLGHPAQPINKGAHFCKINAFTENKDYTKMSMKSSKVNQINRAKFAIRNLFFCREISG